MGIQQQSVQAQIKSLEETQKRFDIESRPLIQITNITVDSLGDNNRTIVKFDYINMGRFPAKILSTKVALTYSIETSIAEIDKFPKGTESRPNFSIGNSITLPSTMVGIPLMVNAYKAYKEGKGFLYLVGEVEYISFVKNKKFSNRFIYKIGALPRFHIVGIRNDDVIL